MVGVGSPMIMMTMTMKKKVKVKVKVRVGLQVEKGGKYFLYRSSYHTFLTPVVVVESQWRILTVVDPYLAALWCATFSEELPSMYSNAVLSLVLNLYV